MSRPTRIDYEAALNRAMSRGVARMAVFIDGANRLRFREIAGDLVDGGALVVHGRSP